MFVCFSFICHWGGEIGGITERQEGKRFTLFLISYSNLFQLLKFRFSKNTGSLICRFESYGAVVAFHDRLELVVNTTW